MDSTHSDPVWFIRLGSIKGSAFLAFLWHCFTLFDGAEVDDPALVPQQLLLLVSHPLPRTEDWILAITLLLCRHLLALALFSPQRSE